MPMSVIERIQKHTVKIYGLNDRMVSEEKIAARRLLHPSRFDLFAKLYYIRNRQRNPELAVKVYKEHIKAFNPDLTEPGNSGKSGYDAFLSVFDNLIEQFRTEEFDPEQSLVPVTQDNILLDGAHRVAALAFWDKPVGVARFGDVCPKADFNYDYFKRRGLSWNTMDVIACEMTQYLPNLHVACLWPRIADKSKAISLIGARFYIAYEKTVNVSLRAFQRLIAGVYAGQPWTQNPESLKDKSLQCFGFNRKIVFVFFVADNLNDVVALKDEIRNMYGAGKHSIHITDNSRETQAIAKDVLIAEERAKWADASAAGLIRQRLEERWFYFKHVQMINIKVALARLFFLR